MEYVLHAQITMHSLLLLTESRATYVAPLNALMQFVRMDITTMQEIAARALIRPLLILLVQNAHQQLALKELALPTLISSTL